MMKHLVRLAAALLIVFGCGHHKSNSSNSTGAGADCHSEHCTAFFFTGEGPTQGFARDDENLYWGLYYTSPGGAVVQGALSGGTPNTIVSGIQGPDDIAVAGRRLFYATENEGLVEFNLDTGANTVRDPEGRGPILIAGGRLYYYYNSGYFYQPLVGGPRVVSPWELNGSIVTDGTYHFWSFGGPTDVIQAIRMSDGVRDPTIAADSVDVGTPVAVDADNVYTLRGTDLSILQVPRGAGTPVTLAHKNKPGERRTFATDEGFFYWVDTASDFHDMVLKVPIGGGSVTTLSLLVGSNAPVTRLDVANDAIYALITSSVAGRGGIARIAPK
jgi:hypothetical protein